MSFTLIPLLSFHLLNPRFKHYQFHQFLLFHHVFICFTLHYSCSFATLIDFSFPFLLLFSLINRCCLSSLRTAICSSTTTWPTKERYSADSMKEREKKERKKESCQDSFISTTKNIHFHLFFIVSLFLFLLVHSAHCLSSYIHTYS